ncbi:hypothetical protein B0H14DRAFT_2573105 [Mycena olivaceomarginata]|nr:hypothetical protein B0H14DRAFT_2573105 [Mycena olivaceomarginata]
MSPESWGKLPYCRGDSTQRKLALRTKGALVGERNQLSDVGRTRNPIRRRINGVNIFPADRKDGAPELRPGGNSIGIPFGTIGTLATLSAAQWTTGLSGLLDHSHQQAKVPVIFTRENCGLKAKQMVNHDLDEPGTCRNLGELANVGHCCGRLNIGIGIREFARPALKGFRSFETVITTATRSGLSAQWKLHVKSENEVCCHSFIAMFCKVPGSLGALFGSAARLCAKIIVCF